VNLGADRSPHLDDADLLGDFSNLLIGNFSRINRTGFDCRLVGHFPDKA
jgi:hypothetical protein